MSKTIPKAIDDLNDATRVVFALADALVKSYIELRVRYESVPEVHEWIIGPGHYFESPDLLTPSQIQEIIAAVQRGDLVQVNLYGLRLMSQSRIARVVKVYGTSLEVCLWGDNEAHNKFFLTDPARQIWCWYIVGKASGV
jgi:hypothetical protein